MSYINHCLFINSIAFLYKDSILYYITHSVVGGVLNLHVHFKLNNNKTSSEGYKCRTHVGIRMA